MKTEDELLDLYAKTERYGDINYIKDCLTENVVYDSEGLDSPIFGKEQVCKYLERWHQYNENFNVYVDAITHTATAQGMGYVSLEVDYAHANIICVILELKSGLITQIFGVKPRYVRRQTFEKLKSEYFVPRIAKIYEIIKDKL